MKQAEQGPCQTLPGWRGHGVFAHQANIHHRLHVPRPRLSLPEACSGSEALSREGPGHCEQARPSGGGRPRLCHSPGPHLPAVVQSGPSPLGACGTQARLPVT